MALPFLGIALEFPIVGVLGAVSGFWELSAGYPPRSVRFLREYGDLHYLGTSLEVLLWFGWLMYLVSLQFPPVVPLAGVPFWLLESDSCFLLLRGLELTAYLSKF